MIVGINLKLDENKIRKALQILNLESKIQFVEKFKLFNEDLTKVDYFIVFRDLTIPMGVEGYSRNFIDQQLKNNLEKVEELVVHLIEIKNEPSVPLPESNGEQLPKPSDPNLTADN